MLAPGDRLTTPVDTFGTLHFDPPDAGAARTVSMAAALQAVPSDLMPNKTQNARVKLATWIDDSEAKLQPDGHVGRVLVWLVVEPSQPGASPSGACCPSASDAEKRDEYYRSWPADIFAMVDASTGALIHGVMLYGVT